ncbi:hypothetical protein ACFQ3S_03355 [Mucilaginibacter terrae]|uniref:hypothetical protein n=1 Tax=Mucilaginibacter terrae TaxID=1955052 RepID=UPI0036404A10
MIITAEQQEELKLILTDYTKYQETYSEVYDHVITALEVQHDSLNMAFADKVRAILDADFGGLSQLPVMEKKRAKIIHDQISKKQLYFATAFFKFPLSIYTAITAVAVYNLASTKLLSVVLLIAICIMLAPTLIVGFRMLHNAYGKAGKPSIKNNMFNLIGIYGVILYNAINPHLITDRLRLKAPDTLHLLLITALVMFYLVFGLSFIRLYRMESKLKVAL